MQPGKEEFMKEWDYGGQLYERAQAERITGIRVKLASNTEAQEITYGRSKELVTVAQSTILSQPFSRECR
uniref:Transposase n=1 Tax=Syphacia muris TaxID=451379 RepID=A0A0N5ADN7_9BILA